MFFKYKRADLTKIGRPIRKTHITYRPNRREFRIVSFAIELKFNRFVATKKIKMNLTWIIAVVLNFVFTYLIAKYIGTLRQIGYSKSIFWCIVLSPIIGFIIVLSSPKLTEKIQH